MTAPAPRASRTSRKPGRGLDRDREPGARQPRTRVSPEARARVLEAIAKTGYVPNPAARTLRSQKTNMVLVRPAEPRQHLLLEDPARDRGDTVRGRLRHDHRRSRRLARKGGAFRGLRGGRPGRWGHPTERASVRTEPRRAWACDADGVPLVALCEAIPGAEIPQIEVDNREAARGMTAISPRSAIAASPICAAPPTMFSSTSASRATGTD